MPSPESNRAGLNSSYDYSKNPHIEDFKDFIRGRETPEHPWITKQKERVDNILRVFPVLNGEKKVEPEDFSTQHLVESYKALKEQYPQLAVHDADQGLVLTPFDNLEGLEVAIPEEHLEGWATLWHQNLTIANHPSRIHAMRELEESGFKPPQKLEGVLDPDKTDGIIYQLGDLGHARDITLGDTSEHLDLIAKKIQVGKETGESDPEVIEFVEQIRQEQQAHRTELLATAPFSFVGKRVRSYIGTGAMPDIMGSALALETAAKMHMIAEIPEIGIFSDPYKQAQLAEAVLSRLTIDDPLLAGRSQEDKEYIVDLWKSCIVGVLEVDPDKAIERALILAEVGVKSNRAYGHTRGGDIVETTRRFKKHPNLKNNEFFASQLTGVDIALACEAMGADAGVIGVGGGARCTTARDSQLIPTNAPLAWQLRGRLGIPLIGEGGAIDDPIVSAFVGMSAVFGSGALGGGTFEAPGGMFFLKKGGEYLKPYGGEASERFKYLSNRLYPSRTTFFPEGEQKYKQLKPLQESMSEKVLRHWERVVLSAAVLGVDPGPYTVQELQHMDPSPLWYLSATGNFMQNTH